MQFKRVAELNASCENINESVDQKMNIKYTKLGSWRNPAERGLYRSDLLNLKRVIPAEGVYGDLFRIMLF